MKKEFRYGRKIQQLREKCAWTQEHLAIVAGLSSRTIQRVEKDRTQDAETIKSVAAAFDVEIASLRATYLIPESRLVRTRLVTTFKEFISAEQESHHAHTRAKLVSLKDEAEGEVDSLLSQVFCDRVYVEPDEPELWQSYVESIREPLQSLFDLGFGFFLLDESRDLLLPAAPALPKPTADHIEDWRVRHFALVGGHGCFQLNVAEPLHRFNENCSLACNTVFSALKENTGLHLFANALYAVIHSGGEPAVRWCDICFPAQTDGARLSFDYIERVTGMSSIELHSLCEAIAGEPWLEGLA